MSEENNPTPAAPEATPAAPETPPAAQETPPAAPETTPAAPETPPAKTLLDDDESPAAPENNPGEQSKPDDDAIEQFCKAIPATDLGDGVTWSDEILKAMAPELMRLTNNDPSKANGLVKSYASFMQAQARRQQEADEAFNTGLINECHKRFGADIKQVAKFAREGGRAIFGDDLWAALKSTPAFANNPDVLERLALHGRRIAEDRGAITPTNPAPQPAETDVLHRMYGHVKVG